MNLISLQSQLLLIVICTVIPGKSRFINTIISRRIMIIMMKMNEHQIRAFRLNGRGEEEEEEAEKEE